MLGQSAAKKSIHYKKTPTVFKPIGVFLRYKIYVLPYLKRSKNISAKLFESFSKESFILRLKPIGIRTLLISRKELRLQLRKQKLKLFSNTSLS